MPELGPAVEYEARSRLGPAEADAFLTRLWATNWPCAATRGGPRTRRTRIELQADGAGTLLTLTDTFDDLGKAARDGAGWHECLDRGCSSRPRR